MFDNGTPTDPNDDREYVVACRPDGILFADATPSRAINPSLDPPILPAPDRLVVFIDEPAPVALPASNWHLARGGFPTGPLTLGSSPNLRARLEGLPYNGNLEGVPYCPPGTNHQWSSVDTYNREVAVYRSPAGDYFLYSTSGGGFRSGLWVIPLVRQPDPANGGQILAPDPLLNGGRGDWKNNIQVSFPSSGTASLGSCHNIYVDTTPGREALYVTDESNSAVVQLDLVNPLSPGLATARAIERGVAGAELTAHDAMPQGNQLFVSGTRGSGPPLGEVRIYQMPSTLAVPPTLWITIQEWGTPAYNFPTPMGHSVYADWETPYAEPRLFTLAEDAVPSIAKRNYTILRYDPFEELEGPLLPQAFFGAVVPYVFPTGLGVATNPSGFPLHLDPIHNIRGHRRTVLGSSYRRGFGLFDLFNSEPTGLDPLPWPTPLSPTDPYYSVASVGSFDTTVRQDGVAVPPPAYPTTPVSGPLATADYWTGALEISRTSYPFHPQRTERGAWGWLDGFLGCWDTSGFQDSGLFYAGLGPNLDATAQERHLTVGVFRAQEGCINRYWDSTPFPTTSPNRTLGLAPRIVAIQGPLRAGRDFIVGDENAGRYAAATTGGVQLRYQYTLVYSMYAPTGLGPAQQNPSIGPAFWDPDPSSSGNNLILLNVCDLNQPLSNSGVVVTNAIGSPSHAPAGWFGVPGAATQALYTNPPTRFYMQIWVQEYEVLNNGVAKKTGRFSASRGAWIGVARP